MVDELKYEVLPDDYTQHDLSFKLIVIGDSSKISINFRCREIMFNIKSNEERFRR